MCLIIFESFYFSVYNRLTCVTKLRILIENGHVHIFNIIEYTRIYMYMIGLDSDMLFKEYSLRHNQF